MGKILSRIQELASNEGITIGALERQIGASKGVLSRAINNGTDIQSKWLEVIVDNYPLYSTRWLLTGEGRMTIDPSVTVATTTGEGEGIPLIPFDAMAGVFRGEMNAMTSMCEKLYIPGLKADFVIQVSGNSMEPRYYSGDMVACQNISLGDIFFQWGRAYVVDTDQGVLLKRVKQGSSEQTIMLVSENPDYSPFEILRSSIHHIAMVKALVRIE